MSLSYYSSTLYDQLIHYPNVFCRQIKVTETIVRLLVIKQEILLVQLLQYLRLQNNFDLCEP